MILRKRKNKDLWDKCVGILVYPGGDEAYIFTGKGGTAFLPILKYTGRAK